MGSFLELENNNLSQVLEADDYVRAAGTSACR